MDTKALDTEIIEKEVRQSNVKRMIYIATGAVCCNLFILFHFSFNVAGSTPVAAQWRHNILLLQSVVLGINAVLCVLAWYVNGVKNYYGRLANLLVGAAFIILPLWGCIASIIDQMVTSSIIAFFLNCAVCAMALLIRPWRAVAFYIAAYLVFYFGIAITQTDASIVLSNRANAFGAIAICCGLSMLFWRNNLIRFRQARQIQQQQKALQDNYEKLLASAQELQKANATKDKFFSIIAHDLRGPATSTLGLSQMLNEQFKGTDQSEMLQLLQDALSNTLKLLENLLVWSRSQTNEIVFKPMPVNMHNAVAHTVELLALTAAEKNIMVVNNVPARICAFADEEMLYTILRNLLSNAIKFTRDNGSVHIAAIITEAGYMQICLQDTGIGMDEKILQGLFLIDKKVTFTGTRNEKGTGLGLILCKEFIEKNNGRIWAISKPGKGSCFTIELPVAEQSQVPGRRTQVIDGE